jgi:methanogenic corrinoid protein MtbC1
VHDLGVDVAPELYLAESIRLQPDLVGLSILISSGYPALTKAVTQLRNLIPAGFKRPGILIGGGAVDETVFEHTKADLWCRDLLTMGKICRDWIARRNGFTKTAPHII